MTDLPIIFACFVIGAGIGSIAMGWAASGKIADLRTEIADDILVIRSQAREIAYFRSARHRSNAPLKAANAKRSAEAQASRHLRMDVAEKRGACRSGTAAFAVPAEPQVGLVADALQSTSDGETA